MTREDIECIIKWFSHIEQLATDGKTANGFQMPADKILATIKVVAKDSREYVEKFCNDSIPKDLEEAAKKYAKTSFTRPYSDTPEEVITIIEPEKCAGFIAGAKWQKELMMAEVVGAEVWGEVYTSRRIVKSDWLGPEIGKPGDKVRIIVLPKED